MVRCRACRKEIEYYGWGSHVAMHKREYLRKLGQDPNKYYTVNWEDVVRLFNPEEAREMEGFKVFNEVRINRDLKDFL